jgi:DNA-directed RNA polymerase II subunit RPB1
MNIFVCQSLQTQVELEEIAAVERQLITPTSSKTIIGIVQDGLLGAYNLTNPTVKIDWRNAMNIMSYTTLEDFSYIKKNKDYTGSELFSLIIPPGINLNRNGLKIKNGKLVEGRLTNDALGAKKKNNLIQLIWDAYGVEETRKFIDNTQKLVNNYNLWSGFSVGYGDTIIPESAKEEIATKLRTKDLEVEHIITEMENNPDIMNHDLYELKLYSAQDSIRNDASEIVMENMASDNSFQIMKFSGSKGSTINSGQMCGVLGMQAFEGKMMPKKYNNRTLPYFHEHDDRSTSRGVIKQSYVSGLEYPEYVFHLTASRSGIIEQAIKTAETGYAQRKLIKSMEDIMVKYDNTVRGANNGMVQFVYGDSGVDTTKQYEYHINLLNMNNEEVKNKYKFSSQELKNYKDFSEKENVALYETMLKLRDDARTRIRRAKLNYIVLVISFMIPINLSRIIDTNSNDNNAKSKEVLTPLYVVDQLEHLLTNKMTTIICMSEDEQNDPNSMKNKDERLHKSIFRTALYDALSPKRVIFERQINKAQFDNIIRDISNDFNKNMIEPGEMVGVIAGQSNGEPLAVNLRRGTGSGGCASIRWNVRKD